MTGKREGRRGTIEMTGKREGRRAADGRKGKGGETEVGKHKEERCSEVQTDVREREERPRSGSIKRRDVVR